MLVDSHCHLDFDDLKNRLDDVLVEAKKSDVNYILCACSDINSFDGILSIAGQYDNLFVSIGQHPFDVDVGFSIDRMVDFLHKKISENRKKILCIGECGLDYFYNPNDDEKTLQRGIFSTQLSVALNENLPVMIHTRDAGDDTYKLLKSFADKGGRGVIHCFTGNLEDAKRYLSLGFYISASGIITFKKSQDLCDVFSIIPMDRLIVETDAPYLAPVPFRGKTNEPSFVKYVAEKLAKIKSISFEEVEKITTENFKKLYGINL